MSLLSFFHLSELGQKWSFHVYTCMSTFNHPVAHYLAASHDNHVETGCPALGKSRLPRPFFYRTTFILLLICFSKACNRLLTMVSSDFCQAESISFKPKFGDYLADAKVADAAAGAPIAMMYETDAAGHLYRNETGATLRAATSYFRACLANNADIQDDASSLSKTPMHSSLHSSPGAGLSDSDTLSNHGDFHPLMTDNTGNIHTDNSAHSSIGASLSYLDLLSDSNGHPPFSTGLTPAEDFLNSPSRAAPTDSDTLSNPTDHDPTDRTITHNYSVAPIPVSYTHLTLPTIYSV